MATSANVDKETTTKGYFWNIFRLSASFVLFVSLLLVYICTYNNLTSQLQQLRADVDRLKDAQLQLLKLADGDASSTGLEPNRRSKRHHDASNNDSAADNDTSSNENYDDGGSGEVPDRRFDGIWMGTYSRVPMYAIREYCLAMTENCPPPIPGTPGRPGEQGRVGEPGPTGERGVPGTKGERGVVGETGETGMKGDRGEKGEKGHRGRPGLDGLPGNDGINGTDGEKGRRGKRGRHGSPGEKGNKGEQGPEGPPGQLLSDDEMQTIRGPRGVPGPPGLPGPKGDRGDRGDSCGCISTEATTVITTTVEPTIDPRIRDCQIRRIGTPLFYRTMETFWGMWLTDSNPHEQLGQKFWLTKHVSGKQLFYYNNGENVKRDEPDGVYELKELYFGTGNVVYNGSFYYHREGWNEIIRFDLVRNESVAKVQIPFAAYDRREFVYSTEYSYFDLAVDENGLWVIYAAEGDHDFLLVSKLDADDLTIQKTWNITVRHREYGNGLIACGLLYLVKDVQSTSTVIDYAFDLYTKQRLDVRLRFNNPFQMNNMIAFNHAERQIYSWDKGHLLNYPLLLRDRGLY